MMERIRVASLQYFIRPVQTFEQFRDQVTALVETAADDKAHLLVFPEYFTVQLLTLGNIRRPIRGQIIDLARQVPRYIELFTELAHSHKMYIVAPTIPIFDKGRDKIYNDSHFFSPSGEYCVQGKMHMTRFESEEWDVSPRERLKVFDRDFGKVAIAICYDILSRESDVVGHAARFAPGSFSRGAIRRGGKGERPRRRDGGESCRALGRLRHDDELARFHRPRDVSESQPGGAHLVWR